jgi:glucose-6-phosphate dehydrogenase assembly protein OpcA
MFDTGAVTDSFARPDHPPGRPGQPVLRWSSRSRSLDGVLTELGRIWQRPGRAAETDGEQAEAHVAARTSVQNLVVIARRPEIGTRAAAIIAQLTGRHPSRTLILSFSDPDGPSWLDAQIQAFCVVPRADASETCAELVYLTAGGEAGHHLDSLVAPLLIHDLPVTVWSPGEPLFTTQWLRTLTDMSDRLVVDASGWAGNGLSRLAQMAELVDPRIAICDFALTRQSRWREAIAATYDLPEFTPFLRSIRRVAVTYATHDERGEAEGTNLVKPVYHVAWLASRLGMRVSSVLTPAVGRRGTRTAASGGARPRPTMPGPPKRPGPMPVPGGFDAMLHSMSGDVSVVLRPQLSALPGGTTLRVELLAERRGSELRTDVTAEADSVHCRVWQDGVEVLQRRFNAARRTDVELLAETIERTGRDPIAAETLRLAHALIVPERPEGATE